MNTPAPRPQRWLLPVAVAAALAVIGVSELAYRTSHAALDRLASRIAARQDVLTVVRSLVDAETAQRGYLITGREDYLGPFHRVPDEMQAALTRLERHFAADPALLSLAREMHERADERLSEMAATTSLYQRGEHERWRDIMLTNIGREKMDEVRALGQRLLEAEDASVRRERAEIGSAVAASRAGVLLLTALAVVALWFYLRQTAALAAARRRHAQDLQTERDALERDVQRRTAELTRLAQHLQTAREDERARLARELHDELGALLTAAKFDLARLKRGLGEVAPEPQARLAQLARSIDQGIALKRRIIEDLRPSALSHLGLVAALEILAREFGERTHLVVQAQFDEVGLHEDHHIPVYRLVQESLTNVGKHAHATRVDLRLRREGDQVVLAVQDDGAGFEPAAVAVGTHGLTGMRYRVEAMGGRLHIDSAPGRGTRLAARLPAAG
jgi:signal transduction histidine kinase